MLKQPDPPIRVYAASPGGFAESTISYHRDLVQLLRDHGFEVLDPWELTPQSEVEPVFLIVDYQERKDALFQMDKRIAGRNVEAIRTCDIILATLDGQEVDSGTACEMGMGYWDKKVVFGLRSDFRQSGENDGCTINMQVENCIHDSGGVLFTSLNGIRENIHLLVEGGLVSRQRCQTCDG